MSFFSIAIDGPGGAGKSTVSDWLAKKLNFLHLDTGALYRAVGLAVKKAGIDPTDRERVAAFAGTQSVTACSESGKQKTFLNGEDVSVAIRENDISAYASAVSAVPEVRAQLLDLQRSLAKTTDVILDGRDIGTVVLPDADLKIFLTASPEARATRRTLELKQRGVSADYTQIFNEICARDRADSTRAIAPLRQAADAVLIDTGELTFEESCALVLKTVQERLAQR